MPRISYWNGSQWIPVVGDGVEGPAGPPGTSVEIYGPHPDPPGPRGRRKGDVWFMSAARIEPDPIPEPISLVAPSAPGVVSIQPPAQPVSLIRES